MKRKNARRRKMDRLALDLACANAAVLVARNRVRVLEMKLMMAEPVFVDPRDSDHVTASFRVSKLQLETMMPGLREVLVAGWAGRVRAGIERLVPTATDAARRAAGVEQ